MGVGLCYVMMQVRAPMRWRIVMSGSALRCKWRLTLYLRRLAAHSATGKSAGVPWLRGRL